MTLISSQELDAYTNQMPLDSLLLLDSGIFLELLRTRLTTFPTVPDIPCGNNTGGLCTMSSPSMIPVLPPPPGVISDFEGSTQVQRAIIIISAVTLALATAFLGIRIYTVMFIIRMFGVDDGQWRARSSHNTKTVLTFAALLVLILLAWTSSITLIVCGCLGIQNTNRCCDSQGLIDTLLALENGIGKHLWDVSLAQFSGFSTVCLLPSTYYPLHRDYGQRD